MLIYSIESDFRRGKISHIFSRDKIFEDGYIQVAMPTGVIFLWGKNFTDRVKSMNMLPHINYPLYGSIGGGGGGGGGLCNLETRASHEHKPVN